MAGVPGGSKSDVAGVFGIVAAGGYYGFVNGGDTTLSAWAKDINRKQDEAGQLYP